MPPASPTAETWLRSPISSSIGTILMAGSLADSTTIPAQRMRILGSYALVLMLDGKGFYSDETGRYQDLRPGDAVLVLPRLAHAYGSASGEPWKQLYVIFEGPQFDLLHARGVLRSEHPVWRLEPPDLWRRRLEEVFFPAPARNPSEALRTLGRFFQLLTEMAAIDAAARSHPEDAWLEESLHLLGDPQKEGWLPPQVVARKIGMGYETFRKRFAQQTGHPPARYQQQRRIDHACTAIYRGERNFSELADQLAFCDAFHFSKVFRQVMGESPAQYRRRVRGS